MSSSLEVGTPLREGILYVISAPSGTGKTSLCKRIIDIYPSLRHSVSYTTRPPRGDEVDGVDYHFVSRTLFAEMVAQNAFAEWAEVHGNCYGTALATLDEARTAGVDLLLDIDCQGAQQLKKNGVEGVFIFVLPPTRCELERRLRGRNTDSHEVIARRIANAAGEIKEARWYNYAVVNDDLDRAQTRLEAIMTAEGLRSRYQSPLIDALLEEFSLPGASPRT
ncbi:MAG: guanylate kinase [Desulfuromonas sp.]|nr:MAG: guanylate kinase [Desulfuromonas sp.]